MKTVKGSNLMCLGLLPSTTALSEYCYKSALPMLVTPEKAHQFLGEGRIIKSAQFSI